TGALGVSGCWLLTRSVRLSGPLPVALRTAAPSPQPPKPSQGVQWTPSLRSHGAARLRRLSTAPPSGRGGVAVSLLPTAHRLLPTRLPWLALVVLGGFLGQVMLQPNWHDDGAATESMTPIVVLGLAYVAREVGRLGPGARRVFF